MWVHGPLVCVGVCPWAAGLCGCGSMGRWSVRVYAHLPLVCVGAGPWAAGLCGCGSMGRWSVWVYVHRPLVCVGVGPPTAGLCGSGCPSAAGLCGCGCPSAAGVRKSSVHCLLICVGLSNDRWFVREPLSAGYWLYGSVCPLATGYGIWNHVRNM